MESKLVQIALALGLAFLALPTLALCLFELFAAAGFPNSPLIFPCALLIVECSMLFGWQRTFAKSTAVVLASVFLVLVLTMIGAAGYFFDNSWDGQTYHQEIILKISKDWNPIRVLKDPVFQVMAPWFNAKGHEFIAATIFATTKNIEAAKSINFFLLAGSFFLTFGLLKELFSKTRLALITGLVFTCNPITLVQLLTFYVDGAVGSTYVCLLASIGLLLLQKHEPAAKVGIVSATILLLNFKLSCAWMLAATLVITIAFAAIYYRSKYQIRKLACISGVAAIASLVVGVNPYALNIWQLIKHPVHSTKLSIDGIKLVGRFAPPDFNDTYTNRLTKIIAGTLGETNNSSDIASGADFESVYPTKLIEEHPNLQPIHFYHDPVRIAAPFVFSVKELKLFKLCDMRIGGFGPWFGEVLFVSITYFLLAVCMLRKQKQSKETSISLYFAATVTLSTLIIEHAWWARFVPQLWTLPVFIAIAIYFWSDKSKYSSVLLYGTISLLLTNALMTTAPNWIANWQDSQTFYAQLELAKKKCAAGFAINVYVPKFVSLYPTVMERLKEAHVPCELVETQPNSTDYCYRISDLPIFCYAAKAISKPSETP